MNWFDRFLWFTSSLIAGGMIVFLWTFAEYSLAEPIVTESTTPATTNGSMTTTVKSPPPSAIAPQMSTGNSNDICVVGASGAVQTQIFGLSFGGHVTDQTCATIRKARVMADLGMKVSAVSIMCSDPMVFDAMLRSATPCPATPMGLIGAEARDYWLANPDDRPWLNKSDSVMGEQDEETAQDKRNKALAIIGGIFGSALLF